jgi:hypothetical protein
MRILYPSIDKPPQQSYDGGQIDIEVPSDRSPAPSDPWIANMGIFQDDPTFDDFLEEVNSYRNAIKTIA